MTEELTPFAPALSRELSEERIQSARRINVLRFWGVSAFFALFVVLGGILRLPAWTGNLELFAIYWVVTALVYWAGRLVPRVAPLTTLAVALVDVPVVFFLQWATIPTSPSASGVAGFTVGVYVLLVILAALSLQNWYIWFTAVIAAVFEVLLQYLADVSVGGMVSTVFVLALSAAACSYARSRLVALVARVERDIVAQRQTENALREAERMAALGTLAAGVAHEINTPLTYVVTNLALISERLPALGGAVVADGPPDRAARIAAIEEIVARARVASDQLVFGFSKRLPDALRHDFNNAQTLIVYALARIADELTELARDGDGGPGAPVSGATLVQIDRMLQQAREGVDRVRTIVLDLKMFSRPDAPVAGGVDLWRVLDSSINLATSEIYQRARLTTDRGPVPLVLANEARLGQVFVNLLVNAAQAIPEGDVTRNEIGVATRTDEAGRAVVEVRDTGAGIAPELLGRLFDPFFTTKPMGEGTGLGLSICHGIVSALGGELTVESELGHGSTFRVALPAATGVERAPARVAPLPPVAAAAPARRARILVIDDDPRIGDAVRESLVPEHNVVAVTNATAALRLLEKGEFFDLILCDLMMPAMTGMELHEELVRIEPSQAARMSFLTGGAFTPRAQAFLAEVPNPRLQKPFDPQGLRSFVRALV